MSRIFEVLLGLWVKYLARVGWGSFGLSVYVSGTELLESCSSSILTCWVLTKLTDTLFIVAVLSLSLI